MTFNQKVNLRSFCTLNTGGDAEDFAVAHDVEQLADVVTYCHQANRPLLILGSGSNILPSDDGVPGVTVLNRASAITVFGDGEVVAETGCSFQELFLKTAQAGLMGFEYAVGIPGTLGGALVSNAGAYRSNVSEFILELEVVREGVREWLTPDVMQFAYRNSILRQTYSPKLVVLRVRFRLKSGEAKAIYDEAREYQRQRISKQPPQASAGSFFKNVEDKILAEKLHDLPQKLRAARVVPAGFLIERANLMGTRHRGAMFSSRHANFMLNVGGAAAFDIRSLAEHVKVRVREKFAVELEEEVLYVGDWSRFLPSAVS